MIIIVLQRKNTEFFEINNYCNSYPYYLNETNCNNLTKNRCEWDQEATDLITRKKDEIINHCKIVK